MKAKGREDRTQSSKQLKNGRIALLVLGTASTGETVTLDTDSVSTDRPAGTGLFITATYYLDNERIDATISCRHNYWVVEGTQYTPQSQATQNLISTVCEINNQANRATSFQSIAGLR